ncbi:hypothetical protein HY212_02415 [Candidatus Pacearchaeota archaeon]|nr:hypothetical protein [Candidatus Pacearchaeota archaeon]
MNRGALWLGVAIIVLAIFFLPFGWTTGNVTLDNGTNDTTPPTLTVISSYVNSSNIANFYVNAYDFESLVSLVRVYGPIESTGLIRGSMNCNVNNCTRLLFFSYNPTYDDFGNNYTVEAVSQGGTSKRYVNLVFNGEGNGTQTCTENDGGNKLYVKGDNWGQYLNGTSFNVSDYCADAYNIKEYWCNPNLQLNTYDCRNYENKICVNGVCVANSSQASCTDYDGNNTFTRGYVYGYDTNGTFYNYDDFCNGTNWVGEYTCSGTSPISTLLWCDNGCSGGACVPGNQTQIIDMCSELSQEVMYKVGDLQVAGATVIKKEGDPVMENQYLIVVTANPSPPDTGAVLIVDQIYNNTGSDYTQDKVRFRNAITGQIYDSTIIDEGSGSFIILGLQYGVTYSGSGDTGIVHVTWAPPTQTHTFYCNFPQTPFCTDSDGGVVYNVRGTVMSNAGNFTDYCQGNSTTILNEYSCSPNNMADVSTYSCPYGCSNGVCSEAPIIRKPVCKSIYCIFRKWFGGSSSGNKY